LSDIAELLRGADREVRALERATGIPRRQIVEALEVHAAIPQAEHKTVQRLPATAPAGVLTRLTAAAKPKAVRSPAYLAAVRSMPCFACGVVGYSQAAHPNEGKGMATKADDNRAFPMCGPRPGEAGCHALLDQGGRLNKDERREFERQAGRRTYEQLRSMGKVPMGMPAPRWETEP
jgi:hypothetical protein